MITYLALLKRKAEYEQLLTVVRKYAAIYTDERWSYLAFQSVADVERLLNYEPVLDLVSWDVTMEGALGALERMRKNHDKAYVMIIADPTISPMSYLKPGISPAALLLKPVKSTDAERVIQDLFEVFVRNLNQDQTDAFLVETREGKQYIPMGQIDYFEAKEKKVFVRTRSCEYGFYDTLDTLEGRLPAGFVRCHRSYIVNMKRARTLVLTENLIRMMDDTQVPFSRSYKKMLKEYLKHD